MKLPNLPKLPSISTSAFAVVLELCAFVIIAAGIGMIYPPAGVIAIGVALWWIAQAIEAGDSAPVSVGTE